MAGRRDRIKGMFLGIAIGDALGMPVETMSQDEIRQRFRRVMTYLRPDGHKWSDGQEAGTWTDDTQLSLAVAESIIQSRGIDMPDLALRHVAAYEQDHQGWGGSTKRAVRRLQRGISWKTAGRSDIEGSGFGNGVAMKIAPLGSYPHANVGRLFSPARLIDHESTWRIYMAIIRFAFMTHRSVLGAGSGFAQTQAIWHCLRVRAHAFQPREFLLSVIDACSVAQDHTKTILRFHDGLLSETPADLEDRLVELLANHRKPLSATRLIEMFGAGSCVASDSLPFSYGFFIQNPHSIETLYDVVSAGGDTDTNGSIVGALLGALNGVSVFPDHLIDGLWRKDEILDVADRFCNCFSVRLE